jgi:hypothetical protein
MNINLWGFFDAVRELDRKLQEQKCKCHTPVSLENNQGHFGSSGVQSLEHKNSETPQDQSSFGSQDSEEVK